MAIRHTKGATTTTEGEVAGALSGYSIEGTEGPQYLPSRIIEVGRTATMPEELRHSHGGIAATRYIGWCEAVPGYHLWGCVVPDCPSTSIWPCKKAITKGKERCDTCDDEENTRN